MLTMVTDISDDLLLIMLTEPIEPEVEIFCMPRIEKVVHLEKIYTMKKITVTIMSGY